MTQTATFPNLESLPNVSTQAILFFSPTMGTLTEVDLVTSGSFSTQFHAENLGSSSATLKGITTGNVSINGPTGAIPVSIPAVTETFTAHAFDGKVDYAGQSGKDFAPVTSNSVAQTTVLTSPADLSAFAGNFRIPITVSGHATGAAASTNGDLSAGFGSQTSVTLTVIYHYIPNLPSLVAPPESSPGSQPPTVPGSGSGTGPAASTALTTATSPTTTSLPPASNSLQLPPTRSHTKAVHKKKVAQTRDHPSHKIVHARPKAVSHIHGFKSYTYINR
jgi:hypothetical protein